MNVLAFDTCFDACSVAAGRGMRSLSPIIATIFEPMAIGQAERLMPMIDEAMAEAKLSFQDLDRIAVTVGPGTFTGARICVSAARALALVSGTPIVTISSLALMAHHPSIPGANAGGLAIATDARRGEVYVQHIDRHTLQPLSPPAVYAVTDAAAALGPNPIVVAGSGAKALADAAQAQGLDAIAILPDLLPDALDMLFCAGSWRPAATVAPLYLRAPDAKPPAKSPFAGAHA